MLTADSAEFLSSDRWRRRRPGLLGCIVLLGVTLGCSTEPNTGITSQAADTISQSSGAASMQRVIVTLEPTTASSGTETADATSDAGRMEKAVAHMKATYPTANILRTMPAFGQMVIELPDGELAKLTADPMVRSAKPDARHRTHRNSTQNVE